MTEPKTALKEALERDLKTLADVREELRLQLRLAKADARDEWHALERTWEQVQNEIRRAGSNAKEPLHDIGSAASTLIGELKRGYGRIKSQLDAAKSSN